MLVGRRAERLRELAAESGVERWTTDLGEVLSDPEFDIYFDALVTSARPAAVEAAIAAGKHVYCEKPIAPDLETALRLTAPRAKRPASSTGSSRTSCSCPGS